MIDDETLYELGTMTMDPCSMAKDAYAIARETWLCTGCARPKPGTDSVDVKLQRPPKDIPMNFVYGVSVGIVRTDFLDFLGEDAVQHDLLLGSVFDSNGERISRFATFRGRTRLAIRGDARSQYRRCDICGRHVYSPIGKPYVLSKAPRDVMIYESQLQGFIVREITMRRVNSKSWRELSIQKLSILDVPIDGKPLFYSEDDA